MLLQNDEGKNYYDIDKSQMQNMTPDKDYRFAKFCAPTNYIIEKSKEMFDTEINLRKIDDENMNFEKSCYKISNISDSVTIIPIFYDLKYKDGTYSLYYVNLYDVYQLNEKIEELYNNRSEVDGFYGLKNFKQYVTEEDKFDQYKIDFKLNKDGKAILLGLEKISG